MCVVAVCCGVVWCGVVSCKAQIAAHEATIQELQAKSLRDDATRKQLHNTIQELKGNIRVYCRVRPSSSAAAASAAAASDEQLFSYPEGVDCKAITVNDTTKKSVDGTKTTNVMQFTFDRVFR